MLKRSDVMSETKITLRIPPDLLQVLDDVRRDEPDVPNRSAMVRRLIERVAAAKKAEKAASKKPAT